MSDHCKHCAGLGRAPKPSRERIPALEQLILDWARREGFTPSWSEGKRTTVRLTPESEAA